MAKQAKPRVAKYQPPVKWDIDNVDTFRIARGEEIVDVDIQTVSIRELWQAQDHPDRDAMARLMLASLKNPARVPARFLKEVIDQMVDFFGLGGLSALVTSLDADGSNSDTENPGSRS